MPIPYEKGILEAYFFFKNIGPAVNVSCLGEIASDAGSVFQIMLFEGLGSGVNLGIETTNGYYDPIGQAETDTVYYFKVGWDGENTHWMVKGGDIDASGVGGYKTSGVIPTRNRKFGGRNEFYVDDYIVRKVQTLDEPLATVGIEEIIPTAREDWPMFRHDTNHTGYSESIAPKTNNTLWIYETGGIVGTPAVSGGQV